VHWPAAIKRRGELVKESGHLIDIMATCVDVSGAKFPKELNGQAIQPPEGKSLVPAFDGKPVGREAIYWEHEGNRAMRVGKWKLVAKGPAGPWELYDIDHDRIEQHNLVSQEPERVKQMVAQWETWAKRANVLPWIWQPQYGEPAGGGNEQKAAKKSNKKAGMK
jgi:arylsulfatase